MKRFEKVQMWPYLGLKNVEEYLQTGPGLRGQVGGGEQPALGTQ